MRRGKADDALRAAAREAIEILVHLIAPMMPHLAEECWAVARRHRPRCRPPWPEFDPALTVDDEIVLPVQINGKKRGDLTIARDADQLAVEKAVLELDFVRSALRGKSAEEGDRRAAKDRQCRRLTALRHGAQFSSRRRLRHRSSCRRLHGAPALFDVQYQRPADGESATLASIGIKPVETRYGQEVRNQLIFLFGGGAGEPANPGL